MSKKARFIIVISCIACFLIIAPLLVSYSMGYRFDFEKRKIVATGGIYVRTFPSAEKVTVDSNISEKPGLFTNAVFVQDLLPKQHTVLIEKNGYFSYQKTLSVKEKEVTKIENINLFKTNIVFDELAKDVLSFSISPDKKNILAEGSNTKSLDFYYFGISSPNNQKKYSLTLSYTSVSNIIWSNDSNKALVKTSGANGVAYYILDFSKQTQQTAPLSYLSASSTDISFNPQDSSQIFYLKNKTLYSAKNNKASAILSDVVSYKVHDGNIIWISSEGVANRSDLSGKTTKELATGNLTYYNYANYKIEIISGRIFLTNPDALLTYDAQSDSIVEFHSKINNYKLLQSPDWKNMVYYNGSEIYLYAFEKSEYNKNGDNNIKLFSANSGETISNCFWLNNDYIIFESGNKIMISEIDYRGNINTVELSKTYPPSTDSKNPQMSFDSQDSKVYVLANNTLYSSEKLTP